MDFLIYRGKLTRITMFCNLRTLCGKLPGVLSDGLAEETHLIYLSEVRKRPCYWLDYINSDQCRSGFFMKCDPSWQSIFLGNIGIVLSELAFTLRTNLTKLCLWLTPRFMLHMLHYVMDTIPKHPFLVIQGFHWRQNQFYAHHSSGSLLLELKWMMPLKDTLDCCLRESERLEPLL